MQFVFFVAKRWSTLLLAGMLWEEIRCKMLTKEVPQHIKHLLAHCGHNSTHSGNPTMEIILLGSGTGIPLNYRASPSLALIHIDDDPVLFDMGPGTLRQLTKAGIRHEGIRRVFITHFHPDHTADLIHLLFVTRNPAIFKIRNPFAITGPRGMKEFIQRLQEAYADWISLPPEIMTIEEIDVGMNPERDYHKFKLTAQSTKHTPESIAYRIDDRSGKSVVYSGDTGFCNEIVDLAMGADLLILECSFPDGKEVEGHLTPSQAGRIASLAGAKRLLLTHFYPECLATDIAAQCRKTYKDELIVGSDLLHIRI
jgi:ribonuclease BN (tRNA processing enzyme)